MVEDYSVCNRTNDSEYARSLNQEIPQVISRRLTTQQAFPKSAILTLILSELSGSRGLTNRDPAASLPKTKPGGRQETLGRSKTSERVILKHFKTKLRLHSCVL